MPRQVEIQSEMIARMLDQTEAGQQIKRNIDRLVRREQNFRFAFWGAFYLAAIGWFVAAVLGFILWTEPSAKIVRVTTTHKDQSRIIFSKSGKQLQSPKFRP